MPLIPPALRPGDPVRIVAPAGPFDRASFERGLEVLSRRYHPTFDPGIFSSTRYLAGDDDRRLAELQGALSDPGNRAVFCARGGYGSMRILPKLRFDAAPPRAVVGFSDITAIHCAMQVQGLASLHGPVMTQLGRLPESDVERLFSILEGAVPEPIQGTGCVVPGTVEGPLLGGNLSVLTRLLGTPFMPNLTGAILLIEDIGERPYRLDRMWTHLALTGALHSVRGIVLGDFTGCEEKDATYSSGEVLTELAREVGVPCARGFRVGHGEVNQAVPLGLSVRLEADSAQLEFLQPFARREDAS